MEVEPEPIREVETTGALCFRVTEVDLGLPKPKPVAKTKPTALAPPKRGDTKATTATEATVTQVPPAISAVGEVEVPWKVPPKDPKVPPKAPKVPPKAPKVPPKVPAKVPTKVPPKVPPKMPPKAQPKVQPKVPPKIRSKTPQPPKTSSPQVLKAGHYSAPQIKHVWTQFRTLRLVCEIHPIQAHQVVRSVSIIPCASSLFDRIVKGLTLLMHLKASRIVGSLESN